jgi:hypothetical protein
VNARKLPDGTIAVQCSPRDLRAMRADYAAPGLRCTRALTVWVGPGGGVMAGALDRAGGLPLTAVLALADSAPALAARRGAGGAR